MALTLTVGLMNHAGKYLTAETFGFAINCNGNNLKKKQIFTIEAEDAGVFIKSHLGRYIGIDENGRKITGSAEDVSSNPNDFCFVNETLADGRWAFRNVSNNLYFGGSGDKLDCYVKDPQEDRLWTVVLAMHPQVCIENVNRHRYIHLSGDEITTDEDVPWGADAMVTLKFFEEGNTGRYGIEVFDGRFLSTNGTLKKEADESCKFVLQFVGKAMAFKQNIGGEWKYLTAVGGKGVLKCTKSADGGPTKDEQFILEDSQPQLKLKCLGNNKFASVRTGTEVTAAQADAEDTETFQLEINKDTKQWSLRTCKVLSWHCSADGTITSDVKPANRDANSYFDCIWQGTTVSFKANNGRYVQMKKNGALVANADTYDQPEAQFQFEIINRPNLVLRGEHGFIGSLPSGLLQCNRTAPEVFTMHVKAGNNHIKGANGKYWKVQPNGLAVSGAQPQDIYFEFVEHSKFLIKVAETGKYLQGHQNGELTPTGTKADSSTLWEY